MKYVDWEHYCMDNPVVHKFVLRQDMPFNLARIHPLKQKEVCEAYFILKKYNVEKAYVFGSASNMKCTIDSDTDFAIGCEVNWAMRSEILGELNRVCENGVDIIWLEGVKRFSNLHGSIARGVKII